LFVVCVNEDMPKRSRTPKRDEVQSAFDTLQRIIKQTEGTGKDPLAVALGRRGGLKGAKALNDSLTAAERKASASKAAKARWANTKKRPKAS
jgi:hypothetical protein